MGEVDIATLNRIYRACLDFSKDQKCKWKEDSGDYETAIIVNGKSWRVADPKENWDNLAEGDNLFVPDIMEINYKIIIEYEEESKPMKGPKIRKKGHWEESRRDSRRDYHYAAAGFLVLKIWESEYKNGTWKKKLKSFLTTIFNTHK